MRRGVHIFADNFGTVAHIVVSDLYIHDINGLHESGGRNIKDNGGIIFRTRGERVPSRFDGLQIERNIIWKVDRSALSAFGPPGLRWSRLPGVYSTLKPVTICRRSPRLTSTRRHL